MRYATFSLLGESIQRLAVVHEERLMDLRRLVGSYWGSSFPAGMQEFIEGGPEAWGKMARLAQEAAQSPPADAVVRPEEVRLLAPIPRPRKNVVCLGLNYMAHMEESAKARGRQAKILEVPVF